MSNNQHLNPNNSRNFTLFGHNSILIGTYLLLFVYALRSMLDGFLLETSMLGMMSIEIIELTGLSFTILFAILSGTAVFFSCRRNCRKNHIKVWNTPTSGKPCFTYMHNDFYCCCYPHHWVQSFLNPIFLLY